MPPAGAARVRLDNRVTFSDSTGLYLLTGLPAGSALQTSMYGTDQYIYQYEHELGAPWKNPKVWEKVSYPFWHADRITTPTMFLGGEKDFNVPIAGGEQMYQALQSLGVPSQLGL